MIIMKFGGSSVRDAERINEVSGLIRRHLERRPLVVFSAMGQTTNQLIQAARTALGGKVELAELKNHHLNTARALEVDTASIEELFGELRDLLKGIVLLRELSPKTLDHAVSFGERLAVRIIAPYLDRCGIAARCFDAWEIGFLTNSHFGDAEVLEPTYAAINKTFSAFQQGYPYTPVVTGYVAKDINGTITTLGRGGSDLTAAVLGAALDAEEIQVWKDVDGILSADPRIVCGARPVPQISFEEASELAYFGAKVLHPLSVQPAMRKNIPVRVKNSYNPDHPGTVIVKGAAASEAAVKAITAKRNVTLIDIVSSRMLGQYGFLARVFQIFAQHEISVDMVATSEVSVSLTLNNGAQLERIEKELGEIAAVRVSRGKAIISLISDVTRTSEILSATCHVMHQQGITAQMISQGASKVNIGLVVEDGEAEDCLRALHRHFFEGQEAAV